jgi:hypothetical protein
LKQPLKTVLKMPSKYTRENEEVVCSTRAFLIGTKDGTCDICKANKRIHLFGYGYSICEDCIVVCSTVLEQLRFEQTKLKYP